MRSSSIDGRHCIGSKCRQDVSRRTERKHGSQFPGRSTLLRNHARKNCRVAGSPGRFSLADLRRLLARFQKSDESRATNESSAAKAIDPQPSFTRSPHPVPSDPHPLLKLVKRIDAARVNATGVGRAMFRGDASSRGALRPGISHSGSLKLNLDSELL